MKKQQTYAMGIDIGGTKMRAILFDGQKAVHEYTLATPKDSYDHFMIMLMALIKPLLEKAEAEKISVRGLGVGLAAALDIEKTKILVAPNIPIIENQNFVNDLAEKTGLPVFMDNDARCFVRAEALFGAAKKYKSIYGVILGTGIGGAWFIDGKVHEGMHGGAGEPGAMVVDFQNKVGLEEAYHKIMQGNPAGVAEEAYRGDVLAEKVYQEFGTMLGCALANIVNLLAPEVFVLGGGVVESHDLFFKYLKKALYEHVMSPEAKSVPILSSKLGRDAGAIGAALLVPLV